MLLSHGNKQVGVAEWQIIGTYQLSCRQQLTYIDISKTRGIPHYIRSKKNIGKEFEQAISVSEVGFRMPHKWFHQSLQAGLGYLFPNKVSKVDSSLLLGIFIAISIVIGEF